MSEKQVINKRYELQLSIGAGRESEVWRAVDISNGTVVAIKKYHSKSNKKELLGNLSDLRSKRSSSLVSVYDYFEWDDSIYCVMDFIEAQKLNTFIHSGALSKSERVRLVKSLVAALGKLHGDGIVHGELTPSNILVSVNFTVKFIDPKSCIFRSLDYIVGTANYVAPETLTPNIDPDYRSDIFSLSTIIYEIFESKPCFDCSSIEEYSLKIASSTLLLGELNETPENWKSVVRKGTLIDPGLRPQNIDTLEQMANLKPKRRILWSLIIFFSVSLVAALYIVNKNSSVEFDEILNAPVISLSEQEVTVVANVGKAPFYLRKFPNSDDLVVCNAHSPYLTLISFHSTTPEVKNKIQLSGHHSHDFAPFRNNTLALVSSSVTDSIVVLNLKTLEVEKVLSANKDTQWFLHPDAIAISNKYQRAYVTSWRGGFVTVIDLNTLTPLKKINVSPGPSGAIISEDEREVLISHTVVRFDPERKVTEGVVSIIDVETNEVSRKILNVGKQSSDIKLIHRQNVAVTANFRGQSISLIDVNSNDKLSDIAVRGGSPVDLIVSSKSPYILVANFNHPYVHVVNYETKKVEFVLKSRHFGKETNGITLTKDEEYICITNTDSNDVTCIRNQIDNWKDFVL